MVAQLNEVNWESKIVSASVFMTVIIMVLSYSISIGIAWGFLTYSLGTIAKGKYKEMGIGIWILAIIFLAYLFFGL